MIIISPQGFDAWLRGGCFEPQISFHTQFFYILVLNHFLVEVQLAYSVILVSGVQQSDSVIYILFLVEVQLTYNVILVSGVQQSDSVIYIYTYICLYIFFFRFFSTLGYYKKLSIVPCAIQQVLVGYLFYIQQCVYFNTNLLIYPSLPSPLVTVSLFCMSLSHFCFVNKFICIIF